MGRYLNVDNSLFRQDLNSDIYVDKSLIIEKLNNVANKQNKFLCVSRPRRFGKTMATTLINAYYSKGCDSRDLFSKLKIANTPEWDKNLNKFNVLKIDMNAEYENIEDKTNFLKIMSKRIIKELAKQFPQCGLDMDESLEYNLYVPFTNNTAERSIRFLKIKTKVAGCFRSEEGADYYLNIRSYLDTARKQGKNIYQSIRQAFLDNPQYIFSPCL